VNENGALSNLGGAYHDLRQYEKAIGCYEQALRGLAGWWTSGWPPFHKLF
jgi:tetratricopeptide (TPR) repeat protein